jgi:hypothetical protein
MARNRPVTVGPDQTDRATDDQPSHILDKVGLLGSQQNVN